MAEVAQSPAVQTAEANLKKLERFRHDVADARTALGAAAATSEPEKIKAAQAALAAAEKAEAESGVTDRQIALASQAVLDARGEAHTETNVLPEDHGIRTVEADADLSLQLSRGNTKKIAAAETALAEAIAADEADKTAHVTASHERTLATIEGAKS